MADNYGRPAEPGFADKIGSALGDALGGAATGIAEAMWPILLQAALAGTGLALIGYGVKSLFGAKPAEHTTKAAPVAAATAQAARG